MSTHSRLYRYARVVNIVDGDTLDVEIDLGFHVSTCVRLQLAGIDAPEPYGATAVSGTESRNALRQLVLNERVVLEVERIKREDRMDKYGRYVAIVWLERDAFDAENKSVNSRMVTLGHAREYES